MTKDEQWVLEEKYAGVLSDAFEADRARLALGEPVAYVIGSQPFLGLTIHLDSHPLIPRSETEWWTEQLLSSLSLSNGPQANVLASAEQHSTAGVIFEALRRPTGRAGGNFSAEKYSVLKNHASRAALTFLDLCAGSGAIGCAALANLQSARVTFAELNPVHKETIESNIRENNLDEARADIAIGDLFTPLLNRRFDVIACNPPYIPTERSLERSVVDFEPPMALFSGDDGLGLMRRIARELPAHLRETGVAWIECDSAHTQAAATLFKAQGLSTELLPDQYGVPRVLVVSFP